jgi:uncharacterized cupredoxin-like copper-binding protein
MYLRTSPRRLIALIAGTFMIVGLTACDGDDGGSSGGGDDQVSVDLQEWAVVPDSDEGPPGEVTFSVHNVGSETHEFVVIKTDIDPIELPTEPDGSVSESADGMEIVDEIEDINPGTNPDLTVDLDPGQYVLICNVVEGDESHYQNGMRTSFTAT